MTLEQTVENIEGNFKNAYKLCVPGTARHVDELMNERRTDKINISVLNPQNVQRLAKKGPIGLVSELYCGCSYVDFDACSRNIDGPYFYDDVRHFSETCFRGERRKVIRQVPKRVRDKFLQVTGTDVKIGATPAPQERGLVIIEGDILNCPFDFDYIVHIDGHNYGFDIQRRITAFLDSDIQPNFQNRLDTLKKVYPNHLKRKVVILTNGLESKTKHEVTYHKIPVLKCVSGHKGSYGTYEREIFETSDGLYIRLNDILDGTGHWFCGNSFEISRSFVRTPLEYLTDIFARFCTKGGLNPDYNLKYSQGILFCQSWPCEGLFSALDVYHNLTVTSCIPCSESKVGHFDVFKREQ